MIDTTQINIDKYIFLDNCDSTNQYAANVLSINNPNHNYCIYTYNQTAGRGQIGRKWYTGTNKNLAVSYIIKALTLNVKDQFYLNMAVSLSVRELISEILQSNELRIKWPNDIYYKDKKIAGILIQNFLKGKSFSQSIIGIGLNLNEQVFPSDIPNPISLLKASEKNVAFNKLEVLDLLTHKITQGLKNIELRKSSIKKNYTEKMYRLNEAHFYESDQKKFEGKIMGVTEEGRLILDRKESITEFNFREVRYII